MKIVCVQRHDPSSRLSLSSECDGNSNPMLLAASCTLWNLLLSSSSHFLRCAKLSQVVKAAEVSAGVELHPGTFPSTLIEDRFCLVKPLFMDL
jgi:hypothetical protein